MLWSCAVFFFMTVVLRWPKEGWIKTCSVLWIPYSLTNASWAMASLSLFQVPNFINTTLPPHEQVTAQEIDSYFRQELIYKRNERMGRRVMSLLRENRDKSFFFAFGAGKAWSFLFYSVTWLEMKCLECFRSLCLREDFLWGFPLNQKYFCLSRLTSKIELL